MFFKTKATCSQCSARASDGLPLIASDEGDAEVEREGEAADIFMLHGFSKHFYCEFLICLCCQVALNLDVAVFLCFARVNDSTKPHGTTFSISTAFPMISAVRFQLRPMTLVSLGNTLHPHYRRMNVVCVSEQWSEKPLPQIGSHAFSVYPMAAVAKEVVYQ